jgi:competence ComEA-like helix-hairpin-helix protein
MKSDHRVVIACLLVIICLLGLFFFVDKGAPKAEQKDTVRKTEYTDTRKEKYYSDYKTPAVHLVYFDPNTADSTVLLGLGLPAWTVRSIYKYRSKGGVFSSPEDFARMNGITAGLYKRLLPYIKISPDFRPAAELVGPRVYNHAASSVDTAHYVKKLDEGERISVNTADTSMLKRVPGIGSYYARKIVALRDRYGGFTDLGQLLEIRGLPEEALKYFTAPDGNVRKLNINHATFSQLQNHPCIGFSRAKSIMSFRRLKGRINSISELRIMKDFDDETINRLEPYVDY